MLKLYIVDLTDEERKTLQTIIKKLRGSPDKVKRAQILIKSDVNGPLYPRIKY